MLSFHLLWFSSRHLSRTLHTKLTYHLLSPNQAVHQARFMLLCSPILIIFPLSWLLLSYCITNWTQPLHLSCASIMQVLPLSFRSEMFLVSVTLSVVNTLSINHTALCINTIFWKLKTLFFFQTVELYFCIIFRLNWYYFPKQAFVSNADSTNCEFKHCSESLERNFHLYHNRNQAQA
jgi:hypothetical protein